jgi:hypothetical protein
VPNDAVRAVFDEAMHDAKMRKAERTEKPGEKRS